MGMSTYVYGIHSTDSDKFKKMKKVYDSCVIADIDPPKEVMDFFGDDEPDPCGIKEDISDEKTFILEYESESESGFEILVSKIPKKYTRIRFVNSW